MNNKKLILSLIIILSIGGLFYFTAMKPAKTEGYAQNISYLDEKRETIKGIGTEYDLLYEKSEEIPVNISGDKGEIEIIFEYDIDNEIQVVLKDKNNNIFFEKKLTGSNIERHTFLLKEQNKYFIKFNIYPGKGYFDLKWEDMILYEIPWS